MTPKSVAYDRIPKYRDSRYGMTSTSPPVPNPMHTAAITPVENRGRAGKEVSTDRRNREQHEGHAFRIEPVDQPARERPARQTRPTHRRHYGNCLARRQSTIDQQRRKMNDHAVHSECHPERDDEKGPEDV
jgi:hypothetical protein